MRTKLRTVFATLVTLALAAVVSVGGPDRVRSAPSTFLALTTDQGYEVKVPPLPQGVREVSGNLWVHAVGVLNNTAGNIDYVNGTSSGFGSLTVAKKNSSAMAAAYHFLLCGRKKAGAMTSLVDNVITVSINSVEVGRVQVEGSTEEVGWYQFTAPVLKGDTRFALTGTSTTGDLIFAATTADPALELTLVLLGDD